MAKISVINMKYLSINRAIQILIDVGMLKVTATIYYRFVFFSKQDLFNVYVFADHYTNK